MWFVDGAKHVSKLAAECRMHWVEYGGKREWSDGGEKDNELMRAGARVFERDGIGGAGGA